MADTLDFKVFCFESFRSEKGLSGKDTIELFNRYGVLDYLEKNYDVLHTTGRDYLINDIEEFIRVRSESK